LVVDPAKINQQSTPLFISTHTPEIIIALFLLSAGALVYAADLSSLRKAVIVMDLKKHPESVIVPRFFLL